MSPRLLSTFSHVSIIEKSRSSNELEVNARVRGWIFARSSDFGRGRHNAPTWKRKYSHLCIYHTLTIRINYCIVWNTPHFTYFHQNESAKKIAANSTNIPPLVGNRFPSFLKKEIDCQRLRGRKMSSQNLRMTRYLRKENWGQQITKAMHSIDES